MRLSSLIYGLPLLLLVITLPVLTVFLTSCQPAAEKEAVVQAEGLCNLPIPEIDSMNLTENETIVMKKHDIPPIDAAAPDRTMTATFSLG